MLLNEDNKNFHLQNGWMLDLEGLYSIISNHVIITSHCQ